MDDTSHQHIVSPHLTDDDVGVPGRVGRLRDRHLIPKSITDRMVERPVTTAAIFILLGAFAAEGLALLFARAQARNALEKSALRNLRLARRIDARDDPLA